MAMGIGGRKGGSISAINMTPMIDVLLVLLIIFMVVQQGLQRGLSVQVPPPRDEQRPAPPATDNLVLELRPDGRYLLNHRPVSRERLAQDLGGVFAGRTRKVLFVKGAESLPYGEVVGAVDASRAAGVQVVGLVPRS
ncbi:MAG TPA: biopolymer transporter ExbD [Longimicrobium sp.]|nr:biopolymer transporter ExbD [Longimicrobium sp.]